MAGYSKRRAGNSASGMGVLVALLTLGAIWDWHRGQRAPRIQPNKTGRRGHPYGRPLLAAAFFIGSCGLFIGGLTLTRAADVPAVPPQGTVLLLVSGPGSHDITVDLEAQVLQRTSSNPFIRIAMQFHGDAYVLREARWMLVATKGSTLHPVPGVSSDVDATIVGPKFDFKPDNLSSDAVALLGDVGQPTSTDNGSNDREATSMVSIGASLRSAVQATRGGRSVGVTPLFGSPTNNYASGGEGEFISKIEGSSDIWQNVETLNISIDAGALLPFELLGRATPAPAEVGRLSWHNTKSLIDSLQGTWETTSVSAEDETRARSVSAGIMFGVAASMLVASLQALSRP